MHLGSGGCVKRSSGFAGARRRAKAPRSIAICCKPSLSLLMNERSFVNSPGLGRGFPMAQAQSFVKPSLFERTFNRFFAIAIGFGLGLGDNYVVEVRGG